MLGVFVLGPAKAVAQADTASSAKASIDAMAGLTGFQGRTLTIAGGSGLIDLGLPVKFGGAGWVFLGHPTARATPRDATYDLRLGYGGLVAAAPLTTSGKLALEARALVGVGNAKVLLPTGATLIGADNFGVVEPALIGRLRLANHLTILADASFRFTFGVEDLPGVGPSDLNGASLRVGLSLGSR